MKKNITKRNGKGQTYWEGKCVLWPFERIVVWKWDFLCNLYILKALNCKKDMQISIFIFFSVFWSQIGWYYDQLKLLNMFVSTETHKMCIENTTTTDNGVLESHIVRWKVVEAKAKRRSNNRPRFFCPSKVLDGNWMEGHENGGDYLLKKK